jgi:predicted N-acetyltransferase YhbS
MAVTTSLLVDHPEHLPLVAGWIYREWTSRRPGSSEADVAERLRSHLRRGGLPLMVLALDGSECCGCASLRAADLEGREDVTPWLASVYVSEARRRAGIGAQLVRAIEAEAARLEVATLYLYTPDRQAFYAARGWIVHEQALHAGQSITIMHKRISRQASLPV